MKRILAILMFVMALGAWGETVKELPKPTGYVSDYAEVLSAEEIGEIERECTALHQTNGTQIAVVTIHRLSGETAQEFAHELFDAWGAGSKGADNGVVLLVVTDDRKRWIEVGYGLEGVLNDAKVGDIGRAMVPALKDGRYGEGIEVGVHAISEAVLGDAGLAVKPAPRARRDDDGFIVPLVVGGFLFFLLVVIVLAKSRTRSVGTGWHPSRTGIATGVGLFSSGGDSSSSSSDSGSSSSSDSGSDFGGFDGGSSGGGGAGGDF